TSGSIVDDIARLHRKDRVNPHAVGRQCNAPGIRRVEAGQRIADYQIMAGGRLPMNQRVEDDRVELRGSRRQRTDRLALQVDLVQGSVLQSGMRTPGSLDRVLEGLLGVSDLNGGNQDRRNSSQLAHIDRPRVRTTLPASPIGMLILVE